MSKIRYKVEISVEVDTDEYPIPADNRLGLSVKDEIIDALEGTLPMQFNIIRVTKVGTKDAEVRNYNND